MEEMPEDISKPFEPVVVRVWPNPEPGTPEALVEKHQRSLMRALMEVFEAGFEPVEAFAMMTATIDEAKRAIDPRLYRNIIVYVCGRNGHGRMIARECCI